MHSEVFILTSSHSLTIRAHSLERNVPNYHNYHIVQLLQILYYAFNFWHHKMWSAKYTWCTFLHNLTVALPTSWICTLFVLLTRNYINISHSSPLLKQEKAFLCFKTTCYKPFLHYNNHSKTVYSIFRKIHGQISETIIMGYFVNILLEITCIKISQTSLLSIETFIQLVWLSPHLSLRGRSCLCYNGTDIPGLLPATAMY